MKRHLYLALLALTAFLVFLAACSDDEIPFFDANSDEEDYVQMKNAFEFDLTGDISDYVDACRKDDAPPECNQTPDDPPIVSGASSSHDPDIDNNPSSSSAGGTPNPGNSSSSAAQNTQSSSSATQGGDSSSSGNSGGGSSSSSSSSNNSQGGSSSSANGGGQSSSSSAAGTTNTLTCNWSNKPASITEGNTLSQNQRPTAACTTGNPTGTTFTPSVTTAFNTAGDIAVSVTATCGTQQTVQCGTLTVTDNSGGGDDNEATYCAGTSKTLTKQSDNNNNTGNCETLNAVCVKIEGSINGGGLSNSAGRTCTVNGDASKTLSGDSNFSSTPNPSSDGYIYLNCSSGTSNSFSVYWW